MMGVVARSGNQFGPAGWRSIMAALEGCTRLTSLNGCSEYPGILAGGLKSLDMDNKELAVAVGPLLTRSASTLVALELR
jgi:hypothetical protein